MSRNIQELLQVMSDMVALEEAFAELYRKFSEKFPEDGEFWLTIVRQEHTHADLIKSLADLVSSHPNEFKLGRPFTITAIKTIMTYIKTSAEQAEKGQIDRRRALFVARDIENSLLEAKYHEIIGTDNVEFKKTIDRITRDTSSHKNLIAEKIAAVR